MLPLFILSNMSSLSPPPAPRKAARPATQPHDEARMHAMQDRFRQRMQEAEARALEESFLDLDIQEKDDRKNNMIVAVAMIDNSQWPHNVVKVSNLGVAMHDSDWQQGVAEHNYQTKNHKADCSTQGKPTVIRTTEYGFWGSQCGCGNMRVYAIDVMRHWMLVMDRYIDETYIRHEDRQRIVDQADEIRREWLVQWRTAVYAQKTPAGLLPILLQRFPEIERELKAAAAAV